MSKITGIVRWSISFTWSWSSYVNCNIKKTILQTKPYLLFVTGKPYTCILYMKNWTVYIISNQHITAQNFYFTLYSRSSNTSCLPVNNS